MRAFYNYLEFDEQITANPFSKIKVKFQEPQTLPKTIPINIIQAILSTAYHELACNSTNFQHRTTQRDIAVLEVLFATGMRVSGLCNLEISNINTGDGMFRINGKGSKERMIQIANKDVLHALQSYEISFSDDISQSGYFFVNRLGNRLSEQSVRDIIRKHTSKA